MFSIIIPLYNKENTIASTLESVLKQTIDNFEVIVVDDGSTDRSSEIVKNINDPRVKYHLQENQGVSAARNKGLSLARFDLVCFLDADDLWHRQFLECISYISILHPSAVIYATAYDSINANNFDEYSIINSEVDYKSCSTTGEIDLITLLSNGIYPFNSSSVCVRKRNNSLISLFDNNQKYAEDVDAWIRISLTGEVIYSSAPMSYYRTYASSHQRNDQFYCKESLSFIQKMFVLVPDMVQQNKINAFAQYLSKSIIAYIVRCDCNLILIANLSLRLRKFVTTYTIIKIYARLCLRIISRVPLFKRIIFGFKS